MTPSVAKYHVTLEPSTAAATSMSQVNVYVLVFTSYDITLYVDEM